MMPGGRVRSFRASSFWIIQLISRSSLVFKNKPKIIGHYSTAGEKEGYGNFKEYFDYAKKNLKTKENLELIQNTVEKLRNRFIVQ